MNKFNKIIIIALLFISAVIAGTFYKLSTPSENRLVFVKRLEVVDLLNKLTPMKMDYAVKLLTEDLDAGASTTGFEDFDLAKYGLKPVEYVQMGERDNYKRSIVLTQNEIIVTFGVGFDGLEIKTFILAATQNTENVFDWSCTGGSLSSTYRPQSCKN